MKREITWGAWLFTFHASRFTLSVVIMRPKLLGATLLSLAWFGVLFCALLAEEPQYGSVRFRVLAAEDGRPLKGARVNWSAPYGSDYRHDSLVIDNADGTGIARKVPVGSYQIYSVYDHLHELGRSDWFDVFEGEQTEVVVRAPLRPFFVRLPLAQHVYRLHENPDLRCETLTTAREAAFDLYQLNAREWAVHDLHRPVRWSGEYHEQERLRALDDKVKSMDAMLQKHGRLLKRWTAPLSKDGRGGYFRVPIALPTERGGLYVVKARVGELCAYNYALITDLGIIVKHAPRGVLVFATRLTKGEPVAGAQVEVFDLERTWQPEQRRYTRQVRRALVGATDAQGIWQQEARLRSESYLVFAQRGDSVAWLDTYNYSAHRDEGYVTYLYTERPVYRPHQTVYFKGVVRAVDRGQYSVPPAGKKVALEVRDATDGRIFRRTYPLSEFGSFSGSLDLGEAASLGTYQMVATIDGVEDYGRFAVAEYRKPDFKVAVRTDRKLYAMGDEIRVSGRADYYYGAPVPKAKVRYTVQRERLYTDGEG